MGAFLLIIMGLLFVEGIRTVFQDGLDPQKGLVVGVALALGVGLENGSVFVGVLGATWSASLGNGMTIGVLATVLLTAFLELTSPRRRRLDVELDASRRRGSTPSYASSRAAAAGTTRRENGCAPPVKRRSSACRSYAATRRPTRRRASSSSRVPVARPWRWSSLVVSERENIEDHLTYLSERAETPEESELSFRLLRHYASSVRHRQYHGIEIVTVKVAGSR